MKRWLTFVAACAFAAPALAQVDQVLTPPPNLVLSSYYSVPVGPFGGLEGPAYAARVADPSAAWFNPAGLARKSTAEISGSAGVYQQTSITPQMLANQGGSTQQLPNYVGLTFAPSASVTVGAALLTSNAWNQETDAESITAVTGGQQRFAYSSDSDFEQRVLALSAGYHADGSPWRIGGGLAFSLMDLRLVESASDRLGTANGLKALLVSARSSASALQMRAQAGAQYDTGNWRFGGALRTPGATLRKSASVTFDGTLDAGASSLGASVFDSDAETEYHLPWELQGGAAYVRDRVEIEVDLQGYSPISTYSLIATVNPVVVYSDAGAGKPPVVTSQPFQGLSSSSDGVVNVSAGGHVRMMTEHDLRIHGGVGTNRSPVNADDHIFQKVDLTTWTVGVSGTFGKLQFSAGVNRQTGTANDVTFRNLLSGQPVTSNVNVAMTGFIYSLAYQF
jgi:hypothetical protein